jgi:hypothetical protein
MDWHPRHILLKVWCVQVYGVCVASYYLQLQLGAWVFRHGETARLPLTCNTLSCTHASTGYYPCQDTHTYWVAGQ